MQNTIYTVDYFIKKFECINEDKWVEGSLQQGDKHCAGGHCGMRLADDYNEIQEAQHLLSILSVLGLKSNRYASEFFCVVAELNDGHFKEYQQATPKQRILAALYDIKKLQQPKVKEVIRYVSVSESLKKQTKQLIEN